MNEFPDQSASGWSIFRNRFFVCFFFRLLTGGESSGGRVFRVGHVMSDAKHGLQTFAAAFEVEGNGARLSYQVPADTILFGPYTFGRVEFEAAAQSHLTGRLEAAAVWIRRRASATFSRAAHREKNVIIVFFFTTNVASVMDRNCSLPTALKHFFSLNEFSLKTIFKKKKWTSTKRNIGVKVFLDATWFRGNGKERPFS